MKQTYSVDLYGKRITIKSEDSREYISSLSEYINAKIDDLTRNKGRGSIPESKLLLLTALNITDELFKERERYKSLKKKIRTKSSALLEKLNGVQDNSAG